MVRNGALKNNNGQHDDLDSPPQIPIFTCAVKTPRRESLSEALTSAATVVVGLLKGSPVTSTSASTLSPRKKAQVPGQYLEHLEKLKRLHESEVLSLEEFNEQKMYAFNNIRELQ